MRSQMAEGLARHLAKPGAVEVRSGGTEPAGYVHPGAIRAMKERGIEISRQASKRLDLAFAAQADAFITLCGPLDDACPRALVARVTDWSMDDPGWGGDPEIRKTRDALEHRIRELFRSWGVLREDAT